MLLKTTFDMSMFSIAKGSYTQHSKVSATLTRSNSGGTPFTVQRNKTGKDKVFLCPKTTKQRCTGCMHITFHKF